MHVSHQTNVRGLLTAILDAVSEFFADRRVLWIVFGVNLVGTLFGFAWYKGQIARTLPYLIPFVPDSPLSSLFFVIALGVFLGKGDRSRQQWAAKHSTTDVRTRIQRIVSALAALWLSQYGIWCVITLLFAWFRSHDLPLEGWVLVFSHGGMAIESVLFSRIVPILRFGMGDMLVAASTLCANDYVDYVYGVFPYLPDMNMLPMMTVLTPALTGLVVWFWYYRVKPSP